MICIHKETSDAKALTISLTYITPTISYPSHLSSPHFLITVPPQTHNHHNHRGGVFSFQNCYSPLLCSGNIDNHGSMRITFLTALVTLLLTGNCSQQPNVVIFRAASIDFYEKPYFGPFLRNVDCYAKLHSYSVQNCFGIKNTSTPHVITPHYWRVRKAMELVLDDTYSDDTLFVYMDVDVAMRYNDTFSIQQLVNQITNIAQEQCDIIFQDYGRNFNSGFFIIRRSPLVREFLQEWWHSCERIGFRNVWMKDQGPANNAVLRLLSKHHGVNYTDQCIHAALSSGPSAAMACYSNWMTDKLMLPPQQRFSHGICLPNNCSTTGGRFITRFGVPVCDSEYQFDSFLLHSKCAKAKAMMVKLDAKC